MLHVKKNNNVRVKLSIQESEITYHIDICIGRYSRLIYLISGMSQYNLSLSYRDTAT